MDLNGISAMVTGGASGLGAATARELAQRGAKVVLADLDRQQDKGEALAKELDGLFVPCDVTDTDQIIAAVDAARELGPLRALVTSAGIGWATRTIGKDGQYESAHNLDMFRTVVNINLVGTFDCIRIAATAMSQTEPLADNERGAIVTVASVAAFDGQIGQVSYSASKGGVVGMTLPVARDLSPVGVRVNCIAPGQIDTPIYGQGDASEQFKDRLEKDILFPKRFGQPEEFASLATELLSNSFMNAEVVRIDGGVRMPPK